MNKQMEEFEKKLEELEKTIEDLSNKKDFIGEVYCAGIDYRMARIPIHNIDNIVRGMFPYWLQFKKSDITANHDGFVKILGEYHKKENVFYYDDSYNSFRTKISKANKPKDKK